MTRNRRTVKHLKSGAKVVTTSHYIPPSKPKQVHHHHHTTLVRRDDSCFPSTAMVLCPNGWKAIAQVEAGDHVMSYSTKTSTLIPRIVKARIDHGLAQLWEIRLAGRSKPLLTTKGHRFLSAGSWVKAENLQPGHTLRIVQPGGDRMEVVCFSGASRKCAPVHNLRTSGEHNFVVEGAIAHNFIHFRRVRSVLDSLFELVLGVESVGSSATPVRSTA